MQTRELGLGGRIGRRLGASLEVRNSKASILSAEPRVRQLLHHRVPKIVPRHLAQVHRSLLADAITVLRTVLIIEVARLVFPTQRTRAAVKGKVRKVLFARIVGLRVIVQPRGLS